MKKKFQEKELKQYHLISTYLDQVDAVHVQHISLAKKHTRLPRLEEMDKIAGFFFFIYYQPQYKSAISAPNKAVQRLKTSGQPK